MLTNGNVKNVVNLIDFDLLNTMVLLVFIENMRNIVIFQIEALIENMGNVVIFQIKVLFFSENEDFNLKNDDVLYIFNEN